MAPAGPARLGGLDGIRGLAALFVVLNHVFLRAFPGYPTNHAPWWAAPFIYGRFAVVVFIVLSGFCLAAAPARAGWRLAGVAEFARRRAWRILPAYWAALVFSLIMTWFVVAQPGWPTPTGRSVLVDGALAQDVFLVPSPNRAFWSIAIEAQLYLVFPLLILAMRRAGALVMLAAVGLPVVYLGILAARGDASAAQVVNQYTPDLAVLFAIGVAAAGLVRRGAVYPWGRFAVLLALPPAVLIVATGSTWTIDHLFWVDLAVGPAIACLLVAVGTGEARVLRRLLDCRPVRRLGTISYSLYLTHAPIVVALYYGLLEGRLPQGVPMFLVLTAVAVPLTVGFAWMFAAVFELPFQRHRGWAAIRRATVRGRSDVSHRACGEGELEVAVAGRARRRRRAHVDVVERDHHAVGREHDERDEGAGRSGVEQPGRRMTGVDDHVERVVLRPLPERDQLLGVRDVRDRQVMRHERVLPRIGHHVAARWARIRHASVMSSVSRSTSTATSRSMTSGASR